MSGSLGERAKQAVLWSAGFGLFRDGLQFLVMLIMVRLLDPEAYGQFALATSIIGCVTLLSFEGFVQHTLQSRAEVDYHLHFTAGAVFQLSAFVIANLIALVVHRIPEYAEVAPLVHVMSFIFLLGWPYELRVKMLQRDLDWRRLRLLQITGLLAIAVTSVLLALAGAGVYALALPGLLITFPFIYDLFIRLRWRPEWRWDWQRYRPAWQYGLSHLPSTLTQRLRPLLEQVLIVAVLGYASAGFFTRAIGVAAIFCLGPARELVQAVYPVMTKIEPATERYRRMSGLVVRGVVWAAAPIAALFSGMAAEVVTLIYGEQWLPVIALLPWAMLFGVLGALQDTLLRLLLANDQIRTYFLANLFSLIGTACSLGLLLFESLVPYLLGLCAAQALLSLFLAGALDRSAGLHLKDLWHTGASALVASGLAFAAAWQALALLTLDQASAGGTLLFGFIFCAVYVGTLRIAFPRQTEELCAYVPRSIPLYSILFPLAARSR